ncbi:MAG: hypothetical protein HYV28_00215 [Ignavibacteriales bacterium]|nr:hypothetical protein [Ignavibacteriales bacterium]
MQFLAQFHPLIVHFPVALLSCYALFEVLAVLFKKEHFGTSAVVLLGLGVVTAFFAMLTGNQAAMIAEQWGASGVRIIPAIPTTLIEEHQQWGSITLFWFLGILILRIYYIIRVRIKKLGVRYENKAKYLFIILGFTGWFFIFKTGEYGGHLVYRNGIGTDLIKPVNSQPQQKHE